MLAAAGLGAGLWIGSGGGTSGVATDPGFAYYTTVMGRFRPGSMMGGSYGWMMGGGGYSWMMGGRAAPGWMAGQALPGFMMGSASDPGQVMGRLFADAPGPRLSPDAATVLGARTPPGAVVDRSADRVVFGGPTVQLTVLAGPAGGPDETFRVAGLVDPTVVVRPGATVRIEVVNADPDTAHGLVITAPGSSSSWMPMMTSAPAFPGAAVWFLGDPTSAGMHTAAMTFTASAAGTYRYLCPVPGHAQKGMSGSFVVAS